MRHRKSSALVVGTHKPEKTRDCWVFPSVLLQKWSALFCLLLGSLYCLAGNYGRKREKWKLTCVTNECVWDWSLRPWIIPEVQNEPRADCMSCTNSKKEVCEIQNKWLKFKSSCWSGEIQTEFTGMNFHLLAIALYLSWEAQPLLSKALMQCLVLLC